MEKTCQPAGEIPEGGGIYHIKAPKAEQKINLTNEGEHFCKNVFLNLVSDCCIVFFPNKILQMKNTIFGKIVHLFIEACSQNQSVMM
jgi:hypothetical protein